MNTALSALAEIVLLGTTCAYVQAEFSVSIIITAWNHASSLNVSSPQLRRVDAETIGLDILSFRDLTWWQRGICKNILMSVMIFIVVTLRGMYKMYL